MRGTGLLGTVLPARKGWEALFEAWSLRKQGVGIALLSHQAAGTAPGSWTYPWCGCMAGAISPKHTGAINPKYTHTAAVAVRRPQPYPALWYAGELKVLWSFALGVCSAPLLLLGAHGVFWKFVP